MQTLQKISLKESILKESSGMLLLCSDGLTGMLLDPETEVIVDSAGHPQQACEMLVQAANDAGGVDNITVVVVQGRG